MFLRDIRPVRVAAVALGREGLRRSGCAVGAIDRLLGDLRFL